MAVHVVGQRLGRVLPVDLRVEEVGEGGGVGERRGEDQDSGGGDHGRLGLCTSSHLESDWRATLPETPNKATFMVSTPAYIDIGDRRGGADNGETPCDRRGWTKVAISVYLLLAFGFDRATHVAVPARPDCAKTPAIIRAHKACSIRITGLNAYYVCST